MLFKSGIITQASGSFGGLTAAHNSGGMYFRARGLVTNPNSPAQVLARAALAQLANAWNQDLSQAQRDAWNLYAANTPLTNSLGDPHNVSGMAMYVRSNTARLYAGEARIDDGPTIFTLGGAAQFSIVADETSQTYTATLIAAAGPTVEFVQLQVGLPQNAGRLFFKGPYRITALNAPGSFPLTATPVFPIAEGQRLFMTARKLMSDGRLGPISYASTIVAA